MSERAQTLEEWLCKKLPVIVSPKPSETRAAALAFTILKSGGWLDARIIPGPACETCGGEGEIWEPEMVPGGSPDTQGEMAPCPTCHGEHAPASIVMAEARTAVIKILHPDYHATAGATAGMPGTGEVDRAAERAADHIITALLGGRVEVAREVVEMPPTIGAECVLMGLNPGDRIAILKNGGRDE